MRGQGLDLVKQLEQGLELVLVLELLLMSEFVWGVQVSERGCVVDFFVSIL
jgi:hypothetical protein